jgi:hypothetical protein
MNQNGTTLQPAQTGDFELQWVNEARSTARVKVGQAVFQVTSATLRSYAAFRGRCALEGILFAVTGLADLRPADRAERWLQLVAQAAAERHGRDQQARAGAGR